MKIALLGYGKMGREVEQAALATNHTITLIIADEPDWKLKVHELKECDVAIDFSMPAAVEANVKYCFEAGIPVVVGTTGWYQHFEKIKHQCLEANGSLLYATNFSIGVNIFFEINRRLASLLDTYPNYKPLLTEIHHTQKLDAPSGTAITLANEIIAANSHYNSFSGPEAASDAIPVVSIREGLVTGTHTVTWASEIDEISITHEAKNRKGFAFGAVMAAEWLINKKGIYTINNMLNF